MECEICGRETGKGKLVNIDGSTMVACQQCANFGKEVEQPQEQKPIHARRVLPPKFQEQELDLGLEIVPDFGKRIRKAREAKGLTVKELAMKIFEKESLLHRIENQSKKPSDQMIEKLEKQLGIELKKKEE